MRLSRKVEGGKVFDGEKEPGAQAQAKCNGDGDGDGNGDPLSAQK